jgi:outer membrane protein OmpA-like peptidoglycan-associated protein
MTQAMQGPAINLRAINLRATNFHLAPRGLRPARTRLALVLALAVASALPLQAQAYDASGPAVIVNLSVLDRLGPAPMVADRRFALPAGAHRSSGHGLANVHSSPQASGQFAGNRRWQSGGVIVNWAALPPIGGATLADAGSRLVLHLPASAAASILPAAGPAAAPLASNAAPAPAAETTPAPIAGAALAATPPASVPAAVPASGGNVVRFAAGAADLGGDARAVLDAVAAKLAAQPAERIQLVAYASAPGTGTDDAIEARRVSLARAVAVRAYLIQHGVASTRIDVRALGNNPAGGGGALDRVDLTVLGS